MQPNSQMPGSGEDSQNTPEQAGSFYPETDNNAQASQPWQTESSQSLDGPQVDRQDWQSYTPSQSLEAQQPGPDAWPDYEGATVATNTYAQEAGQPMQQIYQEPASPAAPREQPSPQYQPRVENVAGNGGGSSLPPPISGVGQEPQSKRHSKKPLILSLAAAFVILAGSAVFVFGYYLPNTPERVWSTALDRTGDQMTTIVEAFQDPDALDTFDKTRATLTGTIAGESYGKTYDYELSVDSLSDDATSQSMAGFKMKSDDSEYDVSADIRTALPDDAIFPNVYFKLSGLSSLGLDTYLPNISKLDNRWIAVEQDFIEEKFVDQIQEMQESSGSERDGLEDVTNENIVSIVADVNTVTQEYVFTSDTEKAVFIMDSFVATEQSEGIEANHYMAKISKQNATKYCLAVVNKLTANDGMKKFYGDDESFVNAVEDAKAECRDYDPDFDWNRAFDIWIDKTHKIFHKIRVYEDLDKKNQEYQELKEECVERYEESHRYIEERVDTYCGYYDDMIVEGESYYEVGQVYEGGSRFVLFSNFVTDTNISKSSGRVDMSIDAISLAVGGSVKYTSKNPDNDDTMEVTAIISTEPYAGDIDSSKPANTMSIQEAIDIVYTGL